jgi:hypothetical protein
MTEPSWPQQVELSAYLSDLEAVQQKFRMPPPVIVLVADLLKRVPRRVGVRSASELVAALLVRASLEPDSLGDAIGDYREAKTHDVLPTDEVAGLFDLLARSGLELN